MKKTHIVFALVLSILSLNIGVFTGKNTVDAQSGCIKLTRSLNLGSRDNSSKDVSALQAFLNAKGYLSVSPTGYFGQMTFVAVKNFQAREGLSAVGNVGPLTRAKISNISCITTLPPVENPPVPVVPITPVKTTRSLPFKLSNLNDFAKLWGTVNVTVDNTLEIKAGTTTNGAQIILTDSNDWTNYKINTNLFVKQSTVTLLARYVDENNFLGCTFSGKYIEIVQRVNGQSTVVNSTTIDYFPQSTFFYNDLNLSMKVNGKKVGCSLIGSDDNVSFENIDSRLMKGGVGLQTWVSAVNIANLELKSFNVDSI